MLKCLIIIIITLWVLARSITKINAVSTPHPELQLDEYQNAGECVIDSLSALNSDLRSSGVTFATLIGCSKQVAQLLGAGITTNLIPPASDGAAFMQAWGNAKNFSEPSNCGVVRCTRNKITQMMAGMQVAQLLHTPAGCGVYAEVAVVNNAMVTHAARLDLHRGAPKSWVTTPWLYLQLLHWFRSCTSIVVGCLSDEKTSMHTENPNRIASNYQSVHVCRHLTLFLSKLESWMGCRYG
jgi:hypothetical protein